MRLPLARTGEPVEVRQRRTPFSYWPAGEGKKRDKLQSTLFASDPWFIIKGAVEKCSNPLASAQGLAFLAQAKDFYSAATGSDVRAAKPLLLYYALLNLAKCFVVFKRDAPLTGRVSHGLSEKLPNTLGSIHGDVSVDVTNIASSAFALFAHALGETLPAATAPAITIQVRSQDFLSQILIGHRVFCQGEGINERFVSLDTIDYRCDQNLKALWLRVRLFSDDLTRLGLSRANLTAALGRAGIWVNVACALEKDGRRIIEIEQRATMAYASRALDSLNLLSASVRPALWRSVTAYPPYRKYYVYFNSPTQTVLNQLLSIYIATFFFGSITRYKPERWAGILQSKIGGFVNEFFENQPSQFLYLVTSEFAEQEVARAAIA